MQEPTGNCQLQVQLPVWTLVKRWDAVHVPDLDTLMIINNGFRGCPVIVQPIPGKGLGLVATRKLVSNQTFAYYYGRVLRDIRWASPFCLASAATGEVMDLYAGSFPSPGTDGIPFVGPFANEPFLGEEPNSHVFDSSEANTNFRRFSLMTLCPVPKGTELVWDYGPNYGVRPYPSKYN